MKPKTKHLLLLLGIPFLLIASECKKHHTNPYSDNGLPPATQTGANIFACRVNGEVWISRSGSSFMGGDVNIKEHTLGIGGFDHNLIGISILDYSLSQNKYILNDTVNAYAVYQVKNSCLNDPSNGYGDVTLVKSNDGLLTLTRVDTINKILSGTFSFKIVTDYCDTLKITDGRFDIRYY